MAKVLRDEVDLPGALGLELLGLAHQALERLRAVLPAHQRDRAEGTGVVAPFRDLQIAHVRRAPEKAADARVARRRVRDETS